MKADYSTSFKHWHPADTAPKDGSMFMGRITGTNRSKAVMWSKDDEKFFSTDGAVNICQWISFTDFGGIRACVWRKA